jgi:hypothetical protein
VVWRADLPEDPLEAEALLNGQALALRQTRRALSAVGPLLAQDLAQAAHGGAVAAHFALEGGAAASAGALLPAGGASTRQAILAQALRRDPQEAAPSEAAPSEAAFGGVAFGGLRDELAEASQAVGRLAALVRRLVGEPAGGGQYALVESGSGGILTARTRLDWQGDLHTWWAPRGLALFTPAPAREAPRSLSLAQMDRASETLGFERADRLPMVENHRRLLAQALATRQEWLRFLLVLTSGATKIGLLAASGPFAPAALWAAWNYAQDVIRQFRRLAATAQIEP